MPNKICTHRQSHKSWPLHIYLHHLCELFTSIHPQCDLWLCYFDSMKIVNDSRPYIILFAMYHTVCKVRGMGDSSNVVWSTVLCNREQH